MSIDTVAFLNSRPPVDEGVYSLTSEEAMFFKSQTGIDDDETLKQHILAVQKKAHEARKHQKYSSMQTYTFNSSIVIPVSGALTLPSMQLQPNRSSSSCSRFGIQDANCADARLSFPP